ncbi:MAG: glycoside hydrolase family 31 protein, partial [Bacteroidota bacterium]
GTLPIIEPYISLQSSNYEKLAASGLLAKDLEGRPYVIEDFWAGPAGLIDIFEPRAQDFVWERVQALMEQGAAGVWSDLIEPENHPSGLRHRPGLAATVHNLYPLVWSGLLYDRFRRSYPERRWFNLVRSGHLGMQRYATFPWTGDVSRTWSGLQAQPKAILGAGLSGLAYLHSDLGGFTGASHDEELYLRWVQFGVFSPIMRIHGNTEEYEPEPIFHDARTQDLVKQAIQLRYQLYPYLNTLAWETHLKAWPWLRPTFFHYPSDSNTFELDAQYLFGQDLMVVPVLAPDLPAVTVYLPAGEWYDFFNGEKYQGGHWYRMPVSEDHLPVFARAGSIIPQGRMGRNLKAWRADTLKWTCYLPASKLESTHGHAYLDDGFSFGAKEAGAYRYIAWRGDWEKQKLWLRLLIEGTGYLGEPAVVHHQLRIKGLSSSPKYIKYGRQKLKEAAWRWQRGELIIDLDLGMTEAELQVVFRKS